MNTFEMTRCERHLLSAGIYERAHTVSDEPDRARGLACRRFGARS